MIEPEKDEEILARLRESTERGAALRKRAMELVSELPGYNWSGIYRLEGYALLLDEYVGAATDHTCIPIGRGVCGTAIAEGKNQIVRDVWQLSNYLACSIDTRSEIVVLIMREGQVLGQIDIDGHSVGAFDASDERFLEQIAAVLAERWD